MQRVSVITGLLLMLTATAILSMPASARAQLATIEANATVYLPVIAGATTLESTRGFNESLLRVAFELVKKRVFDLMVDQIIDYINGYGKPQFITDWRGFFDTVGQTAVGDFVQEIGLGALCSPFKLQVQLAMIAPPRFSEQITCTLGTIIRNVENFYLDFRNGGWLAYQELWAPNNNFYGSLLLAWNAKENEVAAQLAAAGNEALAGQGFLSVKKCRKDRLGRDIPGTCVITTPGTAIGALAQKAIGSDLDFIVNSQDLAVYISAIADAFINRLIRSGVGGLTGMRLISPPPQGVITGVGCEAFLGRAREDCLKYQQQYTNVHQPPAKVGPVQISAALGPRQQGQQMLRDLIDRENQVILQLNTLLNCQFNKNRATAETLALLNQHQQTLDQYLRAAAENDYVIDQLQYTLNSNGAFGVTADMVDPTAAAQFLADQQVKQATTQPLLIELTANLQTRITQCQSQ